MAIDSNASTALDGNAPIENEIPAYRAISPMAVASLILGLLSLLCFANMSFLLVALAAIITGILADRKIRRMPEVLTGLSLARAGIGLAVAFTLASLTVDVVQGYIRKREAIRFANLYINVLKKGTLADALWYRQPPRVRKETSPEEAFTQFEESVAQDPTAGSRKETIDAIKAHLAEGPGSQISLAEIESHGVEELTSYALALMKVTGPHTSEASHQHEDEYALAVLKGRPEEGVRGWWVDEFVYPYTPESHTLKAAGGGHGHAH